MKLKKRQLAAYIFLGNPMLFGKITTAFSYFFRFIHLVKDEGNACHRQGKK